VGRPAAEFLKIEPAAGVVLVVCAVVAMLWANSPWADTYTAVWGLEITFRFGDFELHHTLQDWINDGLMAIFFFVVGVEIKSEIVSGELANPRNAVPPIAAAVGGMIAPALIYTAFNGGGEGAGGWGIPMATDIAFAVGVLALFGSRIPSAARIFLLTLAIVDDLGAIAVIAVFYTDDLSMGWLAIAAALIAAAIVLRVLNVWSGPVYLVIGVLLWVAMLESGVHATIAGVVMGLIISAKPLLDPQVAHEEAQEMAKGGLTAEETERLVKLARDAVPPTERIQARNHRFSSFVVLPLFALANAGVALSGDLFATALTSTVTLGIVLGLVVGKLIGITAVTWLVVKLGWGRMPTGTTWPLLAAIALVAGIGFTVALFITELAFRGGGAELLTDEGKIGVLCASLIAALLGSLAVHLTAPKTPQPDEPGDDDPARAVEDAANAGLAVASDAAVQVWLRPPRHSTTSPSPSAVIAPRPASDRRADRWLPSSKTCSGRGAVKAKLPLHIRVFQCESCGLVLDRDANAARNLAALAVACSTGTGVAGDQGAEVPNLRRADRGPAWRAVGETPRQREETRTDAADGGTDLTSGNTGDAGIRLRSRQRLGLLHCIHSDSTLE
jgi:NhaA family Na+:H+ antiporter